jgi:myosin-9
MHQVKQREGRLNEGKLYLRLQIADRFDDNIILRQLRYTGMLETVRIRRAGYSIRIQYQAFIDQYRILLPNGRNSTREDVKRFFDEHALIERESVQYGKSKIYMRDAEKLLLDDHLHRVKPYLTFIAAFR